MFDETKSIGNEEDRVIEKPSLFATIALFVLTGGIFGIVSLFVDLNKLKILNKKVTAGKFLLMVLSLFIPFLNIYVDLHFSKKFEELSKEYDIELRPRKALCVIFSIFLPLFMNVVSVAVRTYNFNKISDKLYNEGK